MFSFSKLFSRKKPVEETISTNTLLQEPVPYEERKPVPVPRSSIISVTLVNNKTDKEYVYTCPNEFGMTWTITHSPTVICLNYWEDVERTKKFDIGRFIDFSIIKTEHQTFDVLV